MDSLPETDGKSARIVKVRGSFICVISGEEQSLGPRFLSIPQRFTQHGQTKSLLSKLRHHSDVKQFPHLLITMIRTEHNTDVLVTTTIEQPMPRSGIRDKLVRGQTVARRTSPMQCRAVLTIDVRLLNDTLKFVGNLRRIRDRIGIIGQHRMRDFVERMLPARQVRESFEARLFEDLLRRMIFELSQALSHLGFRCRNPLTADCC